MQNETRAAILGSAGTKLREWRDAQGLTQAAAADKIQTGQGTWHAWEDGTKAPELRFALALEDLTGGAVKAFEWAVPRKKPKRRRRRAGAQRKAA